MTEFKKWETHNSRFSLLKMKERTKVSEIRKEIEKRISYFKPQVVFIDYLDNLIPESFRGNRSDLEMNQIIEDINKDPLLINTFSDEEILEIHKKLNPYTSTIVNEGDKKYTCMSYTNLREQYLEKLLTTSLVGYLYRMNDEYEVEELSLIHI